MIKKFENFSTKFDIQELFDKIYYVFLSELDDEFIRYSVKSIKIEPEIDVNMYRVGYFIELDLHKRGVINEIIDKIKKKSNFSKNLIFKWESTWEKDSIVIMTKCELDKSDVYDIIFGNNTEKINIIGDYFNSFLETLPNVKDVEPKASHRGGIKRRVLSTHNDDLRNIVVFSEDMKNLSIDETYFINKLWDISDLGFNFSRAVTKSNFEDYFIKKGVDLKSTTFSQS
jgi:hypothetical protein